MKKILIIQSRKRPEMIAAEQGEYTRATEGQAELTFVSSLDDTLDWEQPQHMLENIGGVILIAPWMVLSIENLDKDEPPETAKPWLETPIDFNKVISHSKKFVGIFSDNDKFVPLIENETLLKEKLGAKTIILHNKGHFTEENNITELPEVLSELL